MAGTGNSLDYPELPVGYTFYGNGTGIPGTTPYTAGFAAINVQRFTATGSLSYTPTSGTAYAIFELVGGGGAGGGTGITLSSQAAAGSAGGAGAYMKILVSGSTNLSNITGSVGAGGLGGITPAVGGNTTLTINGGTVWTAGGGGPGTNGSPVSSPFIQDIGTFYGAATSGTNGSLIVSVTPGSSPTLAICTFISSGTSTILGSMGGGTPLGSSSQPSAISDNTGGSSGNSGYGYGSGAGGAVAGPSQAAILAVAGQPGVVIVTEYII